MKAILTVLMAGVLSLAFTQTGTVKNISVKEMKVAVDKGGDIQIVDVRTPAEWKEGIVSGAHKINYYDTDFATKVKQLDMDKPVYVYCKMGGRSSKAAQQMKSLGFKVIYNVDGGIMAWEDAGYPTVK